MKHAIDPLLVTAGHPLYVLRGARPTPEWVEAAELEPGDYVGHVVPSEVVKVDGLTVGEAWLYGHLLGRGDITPAYVEQEFVKRDATTGAALSAFRFTSDDIWDAARRKRISPRFAHLPVPQARALIQGVLESADVGVGDRGIVFHAGKELLHDVRYQLLRLGVLVEATQTHLSIPAVRNGRIHFLNGDYLVVPGPRLGRGDRGILVGGPVQADRPDPVGHLESHELAGHLAPLVGETEILLRQRIVPLITGPGHRDTTIHLVAQQQERLDHVRERTTTRLAAAQHKRQHLHWWNRGSRAELDPRSPSNGPRSDASTRRASMRSPRPSSRGGAPRSRTCSPVIRSTRSPKHWLPTSSDAGSAGGCRKAPIWSRSAACSA